MYIGRQYLVSRFQALVQSNQLAQSYVFFGEPQVGKCFFAEHLAYLLERGEFAITGRPLQDAQVLRDVNGIDDMRLLKHFLWQKPVFSSRRTVVIDQADRLTPEAQNAILKITEEPPAHSLLILIATHTENLLPPLASRLQKIYFGRLTDPELQSISPDATLIARACGRPGRLARLQEKNELYQLAYQYSDSFLQGSASARSQLIKALVEEQKEKPELLDRFFEELLIALRPQSKKSLHLLRSVLTRLFLIKSYTTNKRLQLEAISSL